MAWERYQSYIFGAMFIKPLQNGLQCRAWVKELYR